MPTVSHSWKASWPMAGVGTWPEMITSGIGIHVGRGDAGHRIGGAGAGSDQRHAHFAGGTRIGIGGMHRRLLMAHQDMLKCILLENRIVDVEHRAARVAENELDVFLLQAADDDFSAGQFHKNFKTRSLLRNPEQ